MGGAPHRGLELGGGWYAKEYANDNWDDYDYTAFAEYTGAVALDSTYSVQVGVDLTPGAVWANATRTLTQAAAQVQDAVEGATITILRGDTLSASLTGLGSLAGYVSLDFTVKAKPEDDADTAAIIRIRLNASGTGDGLLRLNGAEADTPGNGSITIDDADLGNITITLAAAETDDLIPRRNLFYDVQMISASVSTLTDGTCHIVAAGDVTRAVD